MAAFSDSGLFQTEVGEKKRVALAATARALPRRRAGAWATRSPSTPLRGRADFSGAWPCCVLDASPQPASSARPQASAGSTPHRSGDLGTSKLLFADQP